MKRVMRCHDFRSGREATRSEYREYSQGLRQSHGRKFVPARRVAATTAGAPKRGAGAPLAGMRPRRRAEVPRDGALVSRCGVASNSDTVGTCSALRGTLCRAACSCAPASVSRSVVRDGVQGGVFERDAAGLLRLLPQTGLRPTSRSRRDMSCATLRVINPFWLQRTRGSFC